MAIATAGATRTSTGNFSTQGRCLCTGVTFKETSGSATASFTVRADSASGAVICNRTLLANESDGEEYVNPFKASVDATPVFHLTVDSGACSVSIRLA
jgi:hypothetical protein